MNPPGHDHFTPLPPQQGVQFLGFTTSVSRNDFGDAARLRLVLDAVPHMVLVVRPDLTVVDANREARRLMGAEPEVMLRRLCGEALRCFNALAAEGCCGTTPHCPDCSIRQLVAAAAGGISLA